MSKRLVIAAVATAIATTVSSVASAGSARVGNSAGEQGKLLPASDIVMSLLSYGFAPDSEPVLRGHRYILHAINPWGYEVRVVADAQFGDIVAILPIYSWRTNVEARYGTIARIIHVPKDIYGVGDAEPSLQKRSDSAPAAPRDHTAKAKDDVALSPVYPTHFGPKAGAAKLDRSPPQDSGALPSQRPE